MVATVKNVPASIDIRELVTGTGPFGPSEIRGLTQALGGDASAHRDVRAAVRELEQTTDRSPAASVRLGVCQYLLGRYREALETLRSADGGALALFHQGLSHVALEVFDKAKEAFDAAKKSGYDAVACGAAAADALRAGGHLDEALLQGVVVLFHFFSYVLLLITAPSRPVSLLTHSLSQRRLRTRTACYARRCWRSKRRPP
jgi:hypothetical protein